MSEPSSTKTLEAKCYCGSIHFTIDVPQARLPFPVHLCHCSYCRYTTGAPAVFHSPLDGIKPDFVAPSSEANLTRYLSEGNLSTQAFCSTCGCHISSIEPDGHWVVATSIFQEHGPDTFRIKRHIYSKSAQDGGIAKLVTHVNGHELEDRNVEPDNPRAKVVESPPEVGAHGEERLRAQCHCGGVSFSFGRPTQEIIDDEYMGSFLSPVDKTKWAGSLDVCDDCRLVDGTHVVGWTFIPLAACDPPIGSDLKIGTNKTYVSNPGVLRSFCGTCGATVFYSCDERNVDDKRNMVDVATGILRAPEGPMAENWLAWRSRISFEDSGKRFDGGFFEALQEGINKMVVGKYGKELRFTIG